MKNSTKGLCIGGVAGLILALFILSQCDASCAESPVHFFSGVLVLAWGFLGAMQGEAWDHKIGRYVVMAIVVTGVIFTLINFRDYLS